MAVATAEIIIPIKETAANITVKNSGNLFPAMQIITPLSASHFHNSFFLI